MSRAAKLFCLLLVLAVATVSAEEDREGEVKVMLIFSQSTGPSMLNGIRADIGMAEPEVEVWRRGATASKKLKAGEYTITATKVEVCSFDDCVSCPDRHELIRVKADETVDVIFRWKAKWDRVAKKWKCW